MLPVAELKTRPSEKGRRVFGLIRKKWLLLTPEEWVRQQTLHHLIDNYGYRKNLFSVEKQLQWNGLKRRSDIVYYNSAGAPQLLIECKAPEVALQQNAFDQAARYNLALQVPYLAITNFKQSFIAAIDRESKAFHLLDDWPAL